MRLLMYRDTQGTHLGALRDDTVIDLAAVAASSSGSPFPRTLLQLIEAEPEAVEWARSLLDRAGTAQSHPLHGLSLLPPLNPPVGNVICVGRNYQEHAEESARAWGEKVQRPTLFTKAQTSINGPYDPVPIDSSLTKEVDWEAELGVVIGASGLNVPAERALQYVFGYTVINDVSARDIQNSWGGQFFKGKSLNGFCPVGPWVVTRDEIPDPQKLHVTLRVNGKTKQDASTADMIFPVTELIAQISLGMTMPAGALIATGTPAGVGFARQPAEFLQPGDVMETEIAEIGTMRNPIVDAAQEGN